MKFLGAVWAFLLYLGMLGMNFIFTAKPTEIWMICIAAAPIIFWASWTYNLLTSK